MTLSEEAELEDYFKTNPIIELPINIMTDKLKEEIQNKTNEKLDRYAVQQIIPEAVVSATFTVQSKDGINTLLSFRGADIAEFLDELPVIEESLKKLGYVAQPVRSYGGFGKPQAEKKVVGKCPKCGGDVVAKTTKDGKAFTECVNRKFDFTTKRTTGCDYINWDTDSHSTVSSANTSGMSNPSSEGDAPSEAQKKVILDKAPELWNEDLTKKEATQIIGSIFNK